MIRKVPLNELKNRMRCFKKRMDISNPEGGYIQQDKSLLLYWHDAGWNAPHSEKWRGNILGAAKL